jgi:hypothetical protein
MAALELLIFSIHQGMSMNTSTILFLFAALFAFCCGVMAKKKNRNVAVWTIIGFIGGIFSYFIIAFIPYQCAYCRNSFNKNSDGVHCGSCGETNKLNEGDLIKITELEKVVIEKGSSLEVNGVKIKLIQSTGAKLNFVGVKSLEDYLKN